MKKYLCTIFLFFSVLKMFAQSERAMTEAEMKRWTTLSCGLAKCVPSTFKDYSVTAQKCEAFNWAELDFYHDKVNPKPLTVINAKNQATGNYPFYNIYFKKNEDSVAIEEQRYLLLIRDAVTDGKIDQAKVDEAALIESKIRANAELSLTITANMTIDCAKQYFAGTKPINLAIPNTAFSYLYLYPEGHNVVDEDGHGIGGTDVEAFYKEKALVILGAKPKVVTQPSAGKQNWREDKIFPVDKATELLVQPIQNIWVQINGSEADVRALLSLIDWKGLGAMLGK